MNLFFQRFERREIVQVCSLLFHFLPKLFDWIVIRGVGGKIKDRQAVLMLAEELLHCRTGVVPRTILDENNWLPGLGKDFLEIRGIGCRG